MPSTRLIGRYEIKSEIARGGMATVYHAYDPRFERDVAIKLLPQVFLHDPQFKVRFEREAKMIALLEHPAIVPVYDFGEDVGQPYIVMRYMSGGSLTDRLRQGAITIAETTQIVARLAPALDAAHGRNIIHRDLKPGNILFDHYGNGYLSDFGIAHQTIEGSATLTGEAILGTPAYMSPEQIQGDKRIDGRSDIYSLGVLVYQMLTGQAPFQSDTPAKIMMMHVLQPVPDIHQARPELPTDCETIITRSMAKKPEDRYSNASELAFALESITRSEIGSPFIASSAETMVRSKSHQPDYQMATVLTPGETVVQPVKTRQAAAAVPGAIAPKAAKSKLTTFIIPLVVAGCLVVAGIGGLAFMGQRGSGPLAAMLAPPATSTRIENTPTSASTITPTSTQLETNTPVQTSQSLNPPVSTSDIATETAKPEISETPTQPAGGPIIGGADKVAYLNGNDIWAANLDGSDLVQLTDDNTTKSKLQWSADGQAVNYISGKCVYSVYLQDKRKEILNCFNFVDSVKAFEISPDGKYVAASLDSQMYILPNDPDLIRSVSVRDDLTKIAPCKEFAPYVKNYMNYSHWSKDAKKMAMAIWGNATGIGSADLVQIIPVDECIAAPRQIDSFPFPRFIPEEYKTSPSIPSFGWDGTNVFAMNTYITYQGFGNLFSYNSDTKKGGTEINPIDGKCCYRDPVFTPDGTQLLFAHHLYPGGDGKIQLYLMPYGTLGTGEIYEPIPLPLIEAKTIPQPALRPAQK